MAVAFVVVVVVVVRFADWASPVRFLRQLDNISHETGQHNCMKEMSKQRPTMAKKMMIMVANMPMVELRQVDSGPSRVLHLVSGN